MAAEDLEAVVAAEDLEAVVAAEDLDVVVATEDLEAVVAAEDLEAVVAAEDLEATVDELLETAVPALARELALTVLETDELEVVPFLLTMERVSVEETVLPVFLERLPSSVDLLLPYLEFMPIPESKLLRGPPCQV